MLSFTASELEIIRKLDTPAKVQDFINSVPFNFEKNGKDVVKSPIRVLRENSAHCLEGALLAAYILSVHGFKPLLLHLKTTKEDFEHIIAPFQINGYWGAISKTNHSVLRYREPVYETIRELVMSYFHEYFLNDGTKTLRSYSELLDLGTFEEGWEMSEENLWGVDRELDKIKHFDIAPKENLKLLRKADKIEREAGEIQEWKK